MKRTKKETLAIWRDAPEHANLAELVHPIPYGRKGKTYGLDGIRIDGSPEFIEAVLGRLKDLLMLENGETRLATHIADCDQAAAEYNKGNGGHVCYIRCHYRGDEARHVNRTFGVVC